MSHFLDCLLLIYIIVKLQQKSKTSVELINNSDYQNQPLANFLSHLDQSLKAFGVFNSKTLTKKMNCVKRS